LQDAEGFGAILATVSPFFGSIPLSMILGNFLVWLVPPARRILDAEAKPFPETTFWNAQRKLFKLALDNGVSVNRACRRRHRAPLGAVKRLTRRSTGGAKTAHR
jgi:hypothetical protein